MRILDWVYRIASLVVVAIEMVERPGEGAQKKEEAVEIIIDGLNTLVEAKLIPAWIAPIFGNKVFLGWLIDLFVSLANAKGFFSRSGAEA